MDLRRGFAYSFCLLLSIILVHGRKQTGLCRLQVPFKSKFTSSYYDVPSEVWGCSSKAVTPTGQEVHIVHIRNPIQNEVVLNVINRESSGIHSNGLTIILATPSYPVSWTVREERISNQTKHIMVLPRGSMVTSNDLSGEVITKRRLPRNDTDRLMRWATKQYGAVTSVLDVKGGNVVNLRVGYDSSWPVECIASEEYSGGSAVTRSERLAYGCDVVQNTGDRVVHIIQLTSAEPRASDDTKSVTVRVKPGDGEVKPSHVTLVLQTQRPIHWRVIAAEFDGELNVVVKGQTTVDRVATVRELESNKTQYRLVSEVTRKYSPPASFLLATLANHIYIDLAPPGVSRSPTLSGKKHKAGGTSRPRPQLSSFQRQRNLLRRGIYTACLNTGMKVSVRKFLLQGLEKEQLTLLDASCRARDNGTHFILETPLNGCGTREKLLLAGMAYTNKVFMRFDTNLESESNDDLEQSGSGSHNPLSDEEDEQSLSVEFRCEYATPGIAVPEDETNHLLPSTDRTITTYQSTMQFFKFESYYRAMRVFPIVVPEGTTLYVEASLNTARGDGLGSQVHSCWLSAWQLDRPRETKHYLMKNGCKRDADMIWQKGSTPIRHRFSFVLKNVFKVPRFQFLHCQMLVCSINGAHTRENMKMCKDRNSYCMDQRTAHGNELGQNNHLFTRSYAGPLSIDTRRVVPIPKTKVKDDMGEDTGVDIVNYKPVTPKANAASEKEDLSVETSTDAEVVIVNGLGTGPVVGIAFASFTIGILLMAALWGINSYTKPREPPATRLQQPIRGSESSGQSSPNSTASTRA